MEHEVAARLVTSLKEGKLPEADPRDLAAAVQSVADALPRGSGTATEIRKALEVLNAHRHFEHTRIIGTAWVETRPFDPTILKRYAQALIDLYELDRAEELLNGALSKARGTGAQAASEIPEYMGLLGRIEKQRFVKTGDKDTLIAATNRYLEQLAGKSGTDAWFWHGINAVALAAREAREGVTPQYRAVAVPSPSVIRSQMQKLYSDEPKNPWVPATASEAALAQGDCDGAELWLYRFLNHQEAKPFHLQSYDRQLREIWLGDPAAAGTRCVDRLARIMARHLLRTESKFTISTAAIPALKAEIDQEASEDTQGYEKNFLGESTFSLANVRTMLEACSSIGCVTNMSGARLGTGFLVDAAWLGFPFQGPVFVTNAHVISPDVPKAILPQDALVTFEVEAEHAGMPVFYKVGKVLFTSPPTKIGMSSEDALDVTIVRLQLETQAAGRFTALRAAASLPLIQDKTRAYVVGHPLGSGLQISLHDSLLLDIDDAQRLLHYRTPTDPGSSGSPVFNSSWEIIGLHHGGSRTAPRLHGKGEYEANEAISLLAIRERVRGARE